MNKNPTTTMTDNWNYRILVVEDEKEIARAYQEILQPNNVVALRSSRSASPKSSTGAKFPFSVDVTHSPHLALEMVKKSMQMGTPYAMGFFDVRLGADMDGVELARQIAGIDPELYAVIVTAYHDRDIDSIHEFLGPDRTSKWDYLNKPFSQSEILQKARNCVSVWNMIHEKAQREMELAEAQQKLVESERFASIAAVARGVGHEFGNIMMQIMGKAEVSKGKSPEEMKRALEVILEASQRAGEILDRFENMSAPNAMNKKAQVTQLESILNEVIELMSHQFKKHQIKICKLKIDPVQIEVNVTSLVQVIVNLAINAIHAMGTSGQIDFSILDQGNNVELRVRDYGPGIPQKLKDKVLEPFFTTKGDKGSGLGLAISREIVEVEHGGEFLLKDAVGKGLEVVIRLPKTAVKEKKLA